MEMLFSLPLIKIDDWFYLMLKWEDLKLFKTGLEGIAIFSALY